VGLCREGKLPLDEHPHILGWIDRIRSLPGYIPMRGLQDPRPA
jgi:glutathione S-transferase